MSTPDVAPARVPSFHEAAVPIVPVLTITPKDEPDKAPDPDVGLDLRVTDCGRPPDASQLLQDPVPTGLFMPLEIVPENQPRIITSFTPVSSPQ